MPAIGLVTRTSSGGYKGQIKTLIIRAEVDIVANETKANDSQPDYRVLSEGVEIGAGWNRRSEASGRDYVSLSLAAPEFGPRRIDANLGRAAGGDDDSFAAIWNPADYRFSRPSSPRAHKRAGAYQSNELRFRWPENLRST